MPEAIPLHGLYAASYRGVGFFVPDTSSEVGRRISSHYFPGLDFSAYDDQGLYAEKISIEGFYVGDDYILRGQALQRAFETPGIGTLVHPWIGAIDVILPEPATITWSSKELRVVRFSAKFERITHEQQTSVTGIATSSKLVSSGSLLAQAAYDVVSTVDQFTLSRLRSDATIRSASRYVDLWSTLDGTAGAEIRSLLPTNLPSTPKKFLDLIQSVSNAIVSLSQDTVSQSAVAPAAGARLKKTALLPENAIELINSKATHLLDNLPEAPSIPDKILLCAAASDLLAKMAPLITDVSPKSRKEALILRTAVSDVLEACSMALQSLLNTSFAADISVLGRECRNMQMAVIADLNEIIGRLPQTTTVTLERDIDAWSLAHMIYGDNPANIEAGYQDIITRNQLRHPALIMSGTLEILK